MQTEMNIPTCQPLLPQAGFCQSLVAVPGHPRVPQSPKPT